MKDRRWREVLEAVGVVSVVGGLLLVAFEVNQANRIATAQAVMELSSASNEINSARFSDPEVARLILLIEDPESYDVTDLDASRMTGMAYQIHNILWSAQIAHENGLLSDAELDTYRNDLEISLLGWPGLTPHLIEIYETQPGKRDAYVFQPLAELAGSR